MRDAAESSDQAVVVVSSVRIRRVVAVEAALEREEGGAGDDVGIVGGEGGRVDGVGGVSLPVVLSGLSVESVITRRRRWRR